MWLGSQSVGPPRFGEPNYCIGVEELVDFHVLVGYKRVGLDFRLLTNEN